MKDNLKMFGAQSLYLTGAIAAAAVSSLLQTVGRTYLGDYSSFIWSGSEYSYNAIFYILGIILFVGSLVLGYRYFLKKWIVPFRDQSIPVRIVFIVLALLFSILMLAAVVFALFTVVGMNDNMRPEILMVITVLGWPILTFVFLLVAEIGHKGEAA